LFIQIDDEKIPIDISLSGLVRGSGTVSESVDEEDLTRLIGLRAAVSSSSVHLHRTKEILQLWPVAIL
jgi:hypothetical protein